MTRLGSRGIVLGFLLTAILGGVSASAAEPAKSAGPGDKIANSDSLRDLRGNRRSLHDFKDHSAVVLVFLGADCPVSNLYVPTLLELEKKVRGKGVQFLAVYPNENEDLEQIAGVTHDRDLPFPILKDFGQKLASSLGIKRVPTAVVLDGEFALRYRGRIDDRYGVSARRDKATRNDLAEAIDEVVAKKKVSVAETEADGCLVDRSTKKPTKTDVTYTKHVATILQEKCQACHRPEQSAPFSLLTYDDAKKHAATIREVTSERRMPPWQADPRFGHFTNDRRLSKEQIDTLAAWVEGGMVRGDDKDLPKPVEWVKGWAHGKPDQVFTMPEEFEVPADGVLPYKNWIIETKFDEDKWVTVAEARPGNASVVHHVVAYIQTGNDPNPLRANGSLSILVGWAPGDLGLICPPDTALRIPKGAKLRLEMHYTPNGKATKDRSSIGITFAKKPPKYEMFIGEFANMAFEVPPKDPHYKAEASFRLRADARILSFAPHMHWRGKDYSYEVIYPDGKRETLLSVPRWDFNWQNVYRFQEPIKVPKGAKLHSVAHWDNSPNNPLNPDPTKSARFGLQTWEEMMVGFVCYVWERPETAEELAKNPPSAVDQFFDRLDVNGDDFITSDEIPARLKSIMESNGVKLPEKMSREEFTKTFGDLINRFGPRKPEEKKP
jgi:mono/diheme cytochrome c family protein